MAAPPPKAQHVVVAELKHQCRKSGSQRVWAREHGISEQHLSDVLNGRRDISEDIANACGFMRVVTYQRIIQEPAR